jgi:hypothetical protein
MKEILKRGHCVRVQTFGRSMFPLISSIVLIEPAIVKDIIAGDIAVYISGERVVAHRLVRKLIKDGKEILLTKGDTWLESSAVLPENVIGKVIGVEKWGIKLNFKRGIGKIMDIICRSASPLTSRVYSILRNGKYWLVRKNEKSI